MLSLWQPSICCCHPWRQRSAAVLQDTGRGELWLMGACAVCCAVQKWSKGKLKEKVNNLVLFDQVRSWHGSCCLTNAISHTQIVVPVLGLA